MKKVLILCAALALCATSAFAAGVDFTANSCPGNALSSDQLVGFDCAAGQALILTACFQPNEAISDLVGIDATMDLRVAGDLGSSASFWNWSDPNQLTVGLTHVRTAAICAGYLSTWVGIGANSALAFNQISPSTMRMGVACVRPTTLAVTANQKLFGYQFTIDTSASAEGGGGTGVGCMTAPATWVIQKLTPASLAGTPTTTLTVGSLATNCTQISASGTGAVSCGSVPVQRHTWGRLKSLYR